MRGCFECGTTEDIQDHHVVPRLRGGTKTVPLCYSCHCKAHGRDSKGLNHSRLVSEGMRIAAAKDPDYFKKIHKKRLKKAPNLLAKLAQGRIAKANALALKYGEYAVSLRNEGKTQREMAKIFNDSGIKTSRGGENRWSPSTIRSLIIRYESLTTQEDK